MPMHVFGPLEYHLAAQAPPLLHPLAMRGSHKSWTQLVKTG